MVKRARTSKGRYKGDNKSTFYNEAWIGGKAPNKKWKKFIKWLKNCLAWNKQDSW